MNRVVLPYGLCHTLEQASILIFGKKNIALNGASYCTTKLVSLITWLAGPFLMIAVSILTSL